MNRRVAVYIAGATAVVALWYLLLLAPTRTDLADLHRQSLEVEARLDDYNRTIRELPTFLKANQSLEELRRRLNSSLYAKNDILSLFQQLRHEAERYGLKMVGITPPIEELLALNRQAVESDQPQFLNLTLHLQGRYIEFGRFIGHLEDQPYFRSINSCVIRGHPDPQPTVDLSLSFQALIGTLEAG